MVGGLGISPDLLEGAEPSVAAPLVAGDLDDGLMSRAKDTGKFLYKHLEPRERVEKMNTMVRSFTRELLFNIVRIALQWHFGNTEDAWESETEISF